MRRLLSVCRLACSEGKGRLHAWNVTVVRCVVAGIFLGHSPAVEHMCRSVCGSCALTCEVDGCPCEVDGCPRHQPLIRFVSKCDALPATRTQAHAQAHAGTCTPCATRHCCGSKWEEGGACFAYMSCLLAISLQSAYPGLQFGSTLLVSFLLAGVAFKSEDACTTYYMHLLADTAY